MEHCRETADYAKEALSSVGLGNTGWLAGMLHDAGKETESYKSYLVNAVFGHPVHRGSVNHTFAGVRLVLNHLCTETTDQMSRIAAEHIAFAIGAHHGLFDAVNLMGENGFDHRLSKVDMTIEEGVRRFLGHQDLLLLQTQLQQAGQEISAIYGRMSNKDEIPFYSHLVSRLLLSAVIEGDRRSTAEFENPHRANPIRTEECLWSVCLSHLEEKLQGFDKRNDVHLGRGIFSDRCREFAQNPGGIYRLNMPTGAGKTLSSLRYGLAHSQKWGSSTYSL